MIPPWYEWAPAGVGASVAFLAAGVVFATGLHNRTNRRLAAVFLLEGTALTFGAVQGISADLSTGLRNARIIQTAYFVLPLAYLHFLATLPTRLVAPLRSPGGRVVLGALALFYVAVLALRPEWYVSSVTVAGPGHLIWHSDKTPSVLQALYLLQVLVPLFGLAVAITSLRAARPATPARKRAAAYVAAFGTRDALFAGVLAGGILAGDGTVAAEFLYSLGLPLATILPVILLTYGVLRTQLFDIDLKIKVGIRRGTVVAVFVIAVFIAFQIAQQYLNRTYGIVAGGIMTGTLLFLSPRLNKMADKVSDRALPGVTNTSDYIAYKKLEVYRAAFEGALESGAIEQRERATLERIRVKLALSTADVQALEDEVRASSPASAVATGKAAA